MNFKFFQTPTPLLIQEYAKNTLADHIGIEFLEVGESYITGRMPVDNRTCQPMGLLHGGANLVFAETLGSIAGYLMLNPKEKSCVGLEINANHLKPAKEGWVYGKAIPFHIGQNTQVWEIKITNAAGELTCISRLTLAVLHQPAILKGRIPQPEL